MTPGARVQAAIDILHEVLAGSQAADRALRSYFRQRRYAGSRDRTAVAELLFAVLREYAHARWLAGRTPDARTATLLHLQRAGEDVAALFSGEGHAPAAPDDDERRLLSAARAQDETPPAWVAVNCPPWLYDRFAAALGGDTDAELMALNERALVDLRVNLLKTNRERVLAVLAEDGIAATPGTVADTAVRLAERVDLSRHRLILQGHVEVQDEGSQAIAALCAPKPGEQVVDFCAGAGGKSLALAAAMGGKGQIYALDIDNRRLGRLKPRLERARAHNIQSRVLAGDDDPWLASLTGRADCVLVDAPCSGSGAWRRQPEARWQLRAARLEELVGLQERILIRAAPLVKPGGRLIYATCSLLAEENETRIAAFLAAHPEFQPLRDAPGAGSDGVLRLTPRRDGTDGFYAQALVRT